MASPADKKLGVKDLSQDQREVYESILEWNGGEIGMKNPWGLKEKASILTVGGLAGSGKSTLIGVFASETDFHVAYCAFTGRAASILERKLKACGVSTTSLPYMPDEKREKSRFGHLFSGDPNATYCGTIHRLLYRPVINSRDELVGFQKRTELDRDYDLIITDESSMISSEMIEHLKEHGVPILAIGDHGQLPPVQASGSVVENPDLRLEKIHRQAEGSPIIRLAHHIREGGKFSKFSGWNDDVRKGRLRDVDEVLKSLDGLSSGVLCYMNRSRVLLNSKARKALGFKGAPKKGELVICLRNQPPVFNGMRGILVEDSQMETQTSSARAREWILHARVEFPDEGLPASHFEMAAMQFMKEKTLSDLDVVNEEYGLNLKSMRDLGCQYDFGYALTIHRSQGSSFDHAVVYADLPENPDNDLSRRLYYTAITRASRKLTVLAP